jgi:hypothetical protein
MRRAGTTAHKEQGSIGRRKVLLEKSAVFPSARPISSSSEVPAVMTKVSSGTKADITTAAARKIVETERQQQSAKTTRLREARIAKEVSDADAGGGQEMAGVGKGRSRKPRA